MLSPASVPSCSVSEDSSIAWAMTLAVPGEPVRTRIRPLRATRIGMSPRMRRSRSVETAGAAVLVFVEKSLFGAARRMAAMVALEATSWLKPIPSSRRCSICAIKS